MKLTAKQRRQTVDFVDRVTATFVQAFLAVALVTGVNDTTAVKTAAAAGALAAGKFIYAKAQAYTSRGMVPPPRDPNA